MYFSSGFCDDEGWGPLTPDKRSLTDCFRETLFDVALPFSCVAISATALILYKHHGPIPRLIPVYPTRNLAEIIFCLIQLCIWAFFFAWRLESAILERQEATYRIVDPLLSGLTWIYILVLAMMHTNYRKPSSQQLLYHLLGLYTAAFISALVRLRSAIIIYMAGSNYESRLSLGLGIVTLFFSSALFILSATTPMPLDAEEDDLITTNSNEGFKTVNGRILCPEATSSPLSWVIFQWVDPLLWLGYKRPLEQNDLWELTHYHRTRECFEEFSETKKDGRSLVSRIIAANWPWIKLHFFFSISSVFFSFTQPFFLNLILNYIEDPKGRPIEVAYIYVISMFLGSVLTTCFSSQYLYYGRRWNIRGIAMLNTEVYAKALRRKDFTGIVSTDGGDPKADTGKVTNLMSIDADRLAHVPIIMHMFYNAPLEIAIAVWFLYDILGVSCIFGLCVMILTLPMNYFVGMRYDKIQEKLMDARDKRVSLTNELLQGIRMVKFFAWEQNFEKKVSSAREVELRRFIDVFMLNIAFGLLWFASPILVTVVSFLSYTKLFGHDLTAATAFTSITLFGMLREPLNVLPETYMTWVSSRVSLRRLEEYLNEDDTPKYKLDKMERTEEHNLHGTPIIGFEDASFVWHAPKISTTSEAEDQIIKGALAVDTPEILEATDGADLEGFSPAAVVVENREAREEEARAEAETSNPNNVRSEFKLSNLNISFPVGEFSIVCGSTGSGKTSLLMALLGEMDLTQGHVYLPSLNTSNPLQPNLDRYDLHTNRIAYVAQTAWLQHASIRDNILFSAPYEEERYHRVLEMCALTKDLKMLEDGDMTEVGEKGITLSGGQKQRVALARAVYSRAKTVLLDDVLSAVDSHTAKHIFERCLLGDLMKHRTRILVTHHVRLCLKGAGYVVALQNGSVRIQGTVKDLRGGELLSTILDEEEEPTEQQDGVDAAEENIAKVADATAVERVPKEAKKLIEAEKRDTGYVKFHIYATYLRACGGYIYWLLLITAFILVRSANVAEGWWLKVWSAAYGDDSSKRNSTVLLQGVDITSIQSHEFFHVNPFSSWIYNGIETVAETRLAFFKEVDVDYYVGIYCIIEFSAIIISVIRSIMQYWGSLRASRHIFAKLLHRVLRAPIRFFDTTPVGRIMNRFSKDMETVDSELSWNAGFMLQTILGVISVIVVITAITPEFIITSVFIAVLYIFIGTLYAKASRELKRLNSITRSPVFSHFTETLIGVSTIRAFGVESQFMKEILVRNDDYLRPYYLLWMCNRWLLVRVEVAGSLVSFFAGIFILRNINFIDAGLAGLSLSFSGNFLEHVYWLVRQYTTVEMHLNSVERIQEYTVMPEEPPAIIENNRPPAHWPSSGEIEVRDLEIRYASDLDPVIRRVNFDVRPHEKVGIVGRTGSGKSTLALSFFRFVDPSKGTIRIDGIDITEIGVEDLRSRITIIPQDAVLFSGTIRSNLDPFSEHNDSEIMESLRRVHLASSPSALPSRSQSGTSTPTLIESASKQQQQSNTIKSLDAPVSEGGNNFSQGQRQLLCMARALLRNSKIIIMDEATASVDFETDRKIQTTIREEFQNSTLLCIAHRLRTIIDYDRVLVLDHGRIVEYDTPYNLLTSEGTFKDMCAKSGEMDALLEMARKKAKEDELLEEIII